MSTRNSTARIKTLQRRFADFVHVCSGNLRRRSLVCGKEKCRCKGRPAALHGPYYYWSRRHEGRLVQRVLSPEQAEFVRDAIKNYRKVQRLLRRWEEETVKIIELRRTPGHDLRRE